MKQVVSYGGGTNSAGMLVGLLEHGERPDAIVFADTMGEKPHTYRHLHGVMRPRCRRVGFPDIDVVRGTQPQQIADGSLEGECLRQGTLPSRVMGFGSCSDKWKVQPQEQYIRARWEDPVCKLIGFGADEGHRAERAATHLDRHARRYPLIEWGWDRAACLTALTRQDLVDPGKSACFYCPSTKTKEILELRRRYPDLMERALHMERGAREKLYNVKGLGRSFSWAKFLADTDAQGSLFTDADVPQDCTGESCFV